MRKLPLRKVIENISKEIPFECELEDGSLYIKVNRYVPFVCTAIHDGHQLRDDLVDKIALDEYERWYEEDPHTGDFIQSQPIVLIGRDSRFEYDLNRGPDKAIYEEAWGKKVWKRKLSKAQIATSIRKHQNYYKIIYSLISKLENKFEGAIVYDMHSYNHVRWDREVPLFNIGSENIPDKFSEFVEDWRDQLSKIELDHTSNESKINDVFYGRGYNLEYITKNFNNTLVLATEVKKVFCNEETAENYPAVIKSLRKQLKKAILSNAQLFANKNTNWKKTKEAELLPSKLEVDILKVDKELYHLVKDFELLSFVNPTNIEKEKRKFFKNLCTENPEFKYKPVQIDAFDLKRKLLNLEIDKIKDISIQNMYEATINGYIDKIDMLSSLGSEEFLYNSLRYFGEPSKQDIRNAEYLIHLPDMKDEKEIQKYVNVNKAKELIHKEILDYGFKPNIGISKSMVADVMVLNSQKKVLLKEKMKISSKELQALVHHEIGVHLVTTYNSNTQPLKIFNVGLPVNTMTQEGLAVLAEYLSGSFTINRLKKLAFRVIAVNRMCQGNDFKTVYKELTHEYRMDKDAAFKICTRVFRGGGFTKDYLYLRGFTQILKAWKQDTDLSPLIIGKVSIEYYNTILEMIERGIIDPPKYETKVFNNLNTKSINPILDYVLTGLA